MILTGRNVTRIVILIVVALSGMVALQTLLLHNARQLRDRSFKQNVHTALVDAAFNLEVGEVAGEIYSQLDIVAFAHDATQGLPDKMIECADSLVTKVVVSAEGGTATMIKVLPRGRTDLIEKVLDDLSLRNEQPLDERFTVALLDSVVGSSLRNAGVSTEFVCGVKQADRDSLLLVTADGYGPQLLQSELTARLFPGRFLPPFHQLVLFFPVGERMIWGQIAPLLAATVVFMAIIIGCFIYSIRTILAQRRFADGMIAFVNNMTHEFKTPISTMALAAEALARPDVLEQPGTVQRYRKMIVDENTRMHQQVEKILQVAALERGDFELNLGALDLHEVLADAVSGFSLQVENRGGRIDVSPAARRSRIDGDIVHVTNVIHNLLDNAVKYSDGTPLIEVATSNQDGHVIVGVSDRGPGIAASEQARVFDRYYRCQTGNRHDVKGFGLGLSYVRLVAEAHGGRVSLKSRPAGGTVVEVALPLAPGREGSA